MAKKRLKSRQLPFRSMVKKKSILVFSLLLITPASCADPPPQGLGVKDGSLRPCPSSPNCVSSHSNNPRHRVEPLSYTGSPQAAQEKLVAVLASMKRSAIITRNDEYIHCTSSSLIFRFVDDVEFLFLPGEKIIHLRSASRLGYYDFGVNRRRAARIRRLFLSRDR